MKKELALVLRLCTFGLISILAFPAFADKLKCSATKTQGSGSIPWVSTAYEFDFDPDTHAFTVRDAILERFDDGEAKGRYAGNPTKKIAFSWHMVVSNGSGELAPMTYRAAYFVQSKKFLVQAIAKAWNVQSAEARGTCELHHD